MRRMIGRWREGEVAACISKLVLLLNGCRRRLKGQRKLVTRMLLSLQTENMYETCVGGSEYPFPKCALEQRKCSCFGSVAPSLGNCMEIAR